MPRRHTFLGRILLLGGIALSVVVAAAAGSSAVVARRSARTYDYLAAVPHHKVGLVLGCIPEVDGRPNLFFTSRIRAAADLYRAGKVEFLLASGDNHRRGYDEPTAMKQALVAAGVPAARVFCDYAGFTTLDSVLRAKKVFGQDAVTIVSQRFHNERALYFADHCGLSAVGYNATDVPTTAATRLTYLREFGSRTKAVWDVHITHRQPHFLGNRVQISDAPRVETMPRQAG
jgi:vancomycin permeability regulator SanA